MQIEQTNLDGCFIIKPNIFKDDRGYFVETFNSRIFEEKTGLQIKFVQDNESSSNYGVVRGLHFQKNEFAQTKLVRVVKGRILDIAVDLRRDSPTFKKHFSLELNENNKFQLYIPKGFAHGFSVLENDTIVNYKCDNFYSKENDGGVNLNDEDLNIDWKIPIHERIVSEKDLALPILKNIIIEEII